MVNELIKYFAPPDQPLVKLIGPSADGESTVFYVLATPLGSPKKKDFHGEFFMPITHYGDVRMKTHYAFYEHLMNDYNNPYMAQMGVEKQELGISTLLSDEQKKDAGLDLAERWADFEVKRSLEYHDMLCNLVDAKMMGMSTQCFQNGKAKNADGGLTRWVENERSMTPTPAASATLGKVIEVYKTYTGTVKSATPLLPKLALVKNGQIVEIDLENPEAALADAPPAPAPEPEAPVDLSAQLENILNDAPADAAEVTVDAKSLRDVLAQHQTLVTEVKSLKASMSVFIELWGATPEEAKEAILSMMGQQKSVAESLPSLTKSIKGVEDALLTLAKHMKSQKAKDMKDGASDREKQVLDEPAPIKIVSSGVPDHLRRVAK